MKKAVLYGLTTLVFVSITILAACAKPTPVSPGTTTPETTTPAQPIEIIAQHGLPAQSGAGQVFKAFGDRIEKNSDGRVKFTYYWSSSLVPPTETAKAIDAGAIHVGYAGGEIAAYFPMSWYPFNLPFMGIPSMEAGNEIFWDLWNSTPEMRDEWKGFKLLSAGVMPPQEIHTANSQIIVPADTRGHKIALTSAGPMGQMVSDAGGAAVILPPPEVSISLSSGVVDGFFDHFPVLKVSGTLPLLPYHTIVGQRDDQGMSHGVHGIFMKESFFNGLPADLQEIFMDSADTWAVEVMKQDRDIEIAKTIGEAKELNHTIVYLTPDQIKLWQDLARPTHEQWIDEYQAKGKPAQMIYDKVKALIREYSK